MKVTAFLSALVFSRRAALVLLAAVIALSPLAASETSEEALIASFEKALRDGAFAQGSSGRAASVGPVERGIFEFEVERQANDGAPQDEFAFSVAIGERYAIIGAPGRNNDTGAAYVYRRDAGGPDQWGQVRRITLSDGLTGDRFGESVAIYDEMVAVGAPGRTATRGAAFLYDADAGGFEQFGLIKTLLASDSRIGDRLGRSVTLGPDIAAVGAHQRTSSNGLFFNAGAVYIFEGNFGGAGNWGERTIIVPSEELPFSEFGLDCALSGETLVVGSRVADLFAGRIYIFERNLGGLDIWGERKKISSPGGANLDQFGAAVDVDHDTVVVGASRSDAAFVFDRNMGGAENWGLVTDLKSSITGVNDEFGVSVAVNGDVILVGAQAIDSLQGKAFAFQRDSGGLSNWGETAILPNQPIVPNSSFFGNAVDVSSESSVVGAFAKSTFRGAAFFFNNCPSLTPNSFLFAASEASSIIGVTAGGLGCDWTATTLTPWINFTGATTGVISGSVPFTATTNNTGKQRTGTINVNAEVVEITQRATNQTFNDVLVGDFFFDAANRLGAKGITDGCALNLYCPDDFVTRGQMAVFIIRAIFGGDGFTHPETPIFDDVPATHPFFKWIQMMSVLGITDGCAVDKYCPGDNITRGQMAVFIIRARLGAGEVFPFGATPLFVDVPDTHPFFAFIQKMRELSITSGCAEGSFCPGDLVTRGQMAVFIMRGVCNEFLADGTPILISITPSTGAVGSAVPVTIVGLDTSFVNGVTTISLGPGIVVSSIVVSSPTTLTATLTIDIGAAIFPRPVNVRTGTEEANLPHGFNLTGGVSLTGAPMRILPGATPSLTASGAARTAVANFRAVPDFLVRGQTFDARQALAWGGDVRLNGEALLVGDSQRTVGAASGTWLLETSTGTRQLRVVPDFGTTLTGRFDGIRSTSGLEARVWASGLRAEYFEFSDPLTRLPAFGERSASATGAFTSVAVRGGDAVGASLAPDYGVRLSGYLFAPSAGAYRFGLTANEGARLLIDGEEVLRADSRAGLDAAQSDPVRLEAGWRKVTLEYYVTVEAADVRWSWAFGGGRLEPVAEDYLLSESRAALQMLSDGRFAVSGVATAPSRMQLRIVDGDGETVALSPYVTPTRSAEGATKTSLGTLGASR